jgi:hypothetical protein
MGPTDNKDLSQAPTPGTISEDFYFAGQNASGASSTIIQKAKVSIFKFTSAVTGSNLGNTIKWMTHAAFRSTVGTVDDAGTFKQAVTADVTAGTATDKALTCSNVDDLKTAMFPRNQILSSRVDAVVYPASSVVNNWQAYEVDYGDLKVINGFCDFTVATTNTGYVEFTLNNTTSPIISQSGSGSWYDLSGSGTPRHPVGVTVVTGGTDTVKIRIGIETGSTFVNGTTYKFHFASQYITA